MVELVATRLKPLDAVTVSSPISAVATTVSAPAVVEDAGDSVTVATPSSSDKAVSALRLPLPLVVEKLTTTPEADLPAAVFSLAVTVAGEAAVTVPEDSDSVIDAAPSVSLSGALGLLLPPPHAARASKATRANSLFNIDMDFLPSDGILGQRTAARSVTILGVRNTSSSVLLEVRVVLRNSTPSTGMSPSSGTLLTSLLSLCV